MLILLFTVGSFSFGEKPDLLLKRVRPSAATAAHRPTVLARAQLIGRRVRLPRNVRRLRTLDDGRLLLAGGRAHSGGGRLRPGRKRPHHRRPQTSRLQRHLQ